MTGACIGKNQKAALPVLDLAVVGEEYTVHPR